MKSKYVILSAALALTIAMAGCGVGTTSNQETTEQTTDATAEYTSETVVGQITEISDDQVTLTIGTVGDFSDMVANSDTSANADATSNSDISANADASVNTDQSAQPPEKPGESTDSVSSGTTPPDGVGAMPSSVFTAGNETYSFTVLEDTAIYQETESDDAEDTADTADTTDTTDTEDTADTVVSSSDLEKGDIVSLEFDENGAITKITILNAMSSDGMGQPGGQSMGGQSSGVESYTSVNTYTEDTVLDADTITSTGTDENAVLVQSGAEVTLNNVTLNRTSTDSTGGDNSSFYGVGAGLLVTDGTAYVNGGTYTTDAAGGGGIFAYDTGTAYVKDATIRTTQNTSGGIHVAGGGTLYAWDLDVETQGESAAAIRSDRGGGTMVIDGGTYTSNGTGSPAVYCTADISINNATLNATGSEGVCIEGLNTLRLFDTDLISNMPENEQNDCIWSIILYQSMSGDSEVGNSTFEMDGGSITSQSGGLFYTTNTECTITLSDVDIIPSDTNDFFLQCTGNTNARGWGTSGSNGSNCLFTAIDQDMTGDVIWDSISDLDYYMTDGSTLTGAFVNDESYAGTGGSGYANLYLSKDSTWTVTADSTLTNLSAEGTITDAQGNTVSIVSEDGTEYVKGTSQYTVTVTTYSNTVDLSGASTTTSFADYEQEIPSSLS